MADAANRYPTWKYKKDEEAKIVNNAAEEKALGPGWFDTPDFKSTSTEKEADETKSKSKSAS